MHIILHVPDASPEALARGTAAARAVFDAAATVMSGANLCDDRRELEALHCLAELVAIEACLAGVPVPPGCWLECVRLC